MGTNKKLLYICCEYSFKLHWQVNAFQMGTNNIHFYIYVVGTHLNCTDKSMHFKWVPTTYAFIYMLWVFIWSALTSWCISNGYQQHTLLYICCAYAFELHWQVNEIQMGTNNICLYKEVDKRDTSCNLKNMELLDCVGLYESKFLPFKEDLFSEGRQNSFTRAGSQKQLYKSCLPSNCINSFNHFHNSLKQVWYGERCLNIYGISGPEGRQNSFTRAGSQKQLYKSCLPSNCINSFNHFHNSLKQVWYGERCLNIYGISGPEGRQNSFTRAGSQKQLYKSCLPSNCINSFNHFHNSLK